ncbi:MAG: hypothetical protein ABR985_07675 [Methanotrichaceae archaeon]|jgi:hypothetical protein
MAEFDEVLGLLHSIHLTEYGLLVLIGEIQVLLPEELAGKLEGLMGRRVGILRLDGYRLRCLE